MFWSKAKTIGEIGEEAAAKHYKSLGFKIISMRFFNRFGKQLGEIDFIAQKENNLCFVEVKTRTQEVGRYGTPLEAVGKQKQLRLVKIVSLYLQKHPQYRDFGLQIDVCAVILNPIDKSVINVTIIPNAVEDYR